MEHIANDQTPATAAPLESSNDYHLLPATEKQLSYAQKIAQSLNIPLPQNAAGDRRGLSDWIDQNRTKPTGNKFENYPSSKQVAFAERIARIKRRQVPHECFRDRLMMSKWIDYNK